MLDDDPAARVSDAAPAALVEVVVAIVWLSVDSAVPVLHDMHDNQSEQKNSDRVQIQLKTSPKTVLSTISTKAAILDISSPSRIV
mgnify:CR=1 FL=1